MFNRLVFIFVSLVSIISFPFSVSADMCGNAVGASQVSFTLSWSSTALGSGLGASGFSSFDADGDGNKEVLFGTGTGFGSNTSFAIIEFDETQSDFVVLCQAPTFQSAISKIANFHNDTITHGSLVALNDGSVVIYNHALEIKVQLIPTGLSVVNDLALADIDNDGSLEIGVLSATEIKLYDSNTFAFEQSIPYGAASFTTGKFSDTTGIEIALNTGRVLQLDGTTISVLWDYSAIGFSNSFLKSGDIDNDGLDEIVAADGWYNMRTFNADTKGILWEHSADLDIDALGVFDSNGDGIPEVIYGDGQWGGLYGLAGATGTQLWTVNNPDHGTTNLLITNLDTDAGLELLWGAGFSSTGADYLYIHDLSSGLNEWKSGESSGPYYAVAFGDIDNDGIADRVHASFESQSGYGDGIVTAIKGGTNEILWQTASNTFGGHAWTGLHAVAVADLDADGINEVIVGTDKLYDGIVYILNASDGSVKSSVTLEDGSPVYSLKVIDLDGDGDMEILAGGGKEHTGANGVYVYVIDGATATWVSTFPSLGNNWSDLWALDSADIDNDGQDEIIALWDKAYIVDPDTNGLTATLGAYLSMAKSVDVFSGNPVVYLGDSSGSLHTLAANGSTTLVTTLCNDAVDALETLSPVKLVFACGGRFATYDLVGDTVEWQSSEVIDNSLGLHDRLAVHRVAGKNTLLFGGSRVYYFTEATSAGGSVPIAHDASFSGHFNHPLNGTLSATDPSSAPLVFGIYQQPASGSVDIINASTGEFQYTPSRNYSGPVIFEFYVSNGAVGSNIATVSLTLTNTAPIGSSAEHNIHWNSLYLGNLAGTDPDSDPVQFDIVSQPSQGILVLLNEFTGEFSFVNTSPVTDTTSFSYRISDGAEWSPAYTVTLNLTNTPPVATPVDLQSYYSIDLSTFILAQDSDGDNLTYELLTTPATGAAALTSSGLLTYSPEGNNDYSIVFSYRVHDGKDWSAAGEITINVIGEQIVTIYSPVYFSALSASSYAGVSSHSVDFNMVPQGGSGNYQYAWDFGDGATADTQSPSHTFTTPGHYSVRVSVTDSADSVNIASGSLAILVLSSPVELQLNLSATSETENALDVDFNLDIQGGMAPFSVKIDFGDGQVDQLSTSSPTINLSHTYTDYGSYNVVVTLTSKDGANVTMLSMARHQVNVNEPTSNSEQNNSGTSGSMDYWILLLLLAMRMVSIRATKA